MTNTLKLLKSFFKIKMKTENVKINIEYILILKSNVNKKI